jgi:Putative Ig domain
MKKAQLGYRVSLITLILLAIAGCRFNESDDDDLALDDLSGVSDPQNAAPSIWGDPESLTLVGGWYSFRPEASDNDGDALEFSVENKPDWAEFDSLSGTLQGIPGAEDAGIAGNIVISVTDRNSVVSLPSFAIVVKQVQGADDGSGDDRPPASSSPPVIYGEPNTSAVVDSVYSFQAEAEDEDGDDLSFSIVNKPSWASFDTTTGALEGRPAAKDVGTTDPIEVSVSDGSSISALDGFTITVEQAGPLSFSIAWQPPTENEDGTPLTDLAGYRIYYGTSSGKHPEEVRLDSPGLTSYVIDNLAPGTYFLVMTSVNSRDMESKPTPELKFEIGT